MAQQRGRKSAAALALVPHESEPFHSHAEFDPPPPPAHLGKPEQRIWRDVFADFSLTAQISAAVLTTALESHQRARECREIINREGMIIGRDKLHPLLRIERDSRMAWLHGVKVLGLEL